MAAFDGWTIGAMILLPFWIGAFTYALQSFLGWTTKHKRFGLSLWTGVGVPLVLIGGATPIFVLMRQIERSHQYDRCVIHRNAQDPLNGCDQEWVDKLRDKSTKPIL